MSAGISTSSGNFPGEGEFLISIPFAMNTSMSAAVLQTCLYSWLFENFPLQGQIFQEELGIFTEFLENEESLEIF